MYFLLKSWILLFIIQYVSTKLSAQTEWYKKDDIYFYQVNTAWDFENYGIHSLMYLKDTLLIGHQLKVLRYTDKKGQHRDILIQQEGEKVRHYREFLNEFRLMYDFSAQPGDPAPISGYLIESTDTMKIHNIIRKTQIWKKENLRVLVIEGIGMIGDPAYSKLNVCSPPIPHYGCTSEVDGWDYYFRCFGTLSHTIDFPYFDPFSKCFASGTKNEEIYFQVFPESNI
jgi:hypothetical protein